MTEFVKIIFVIFLPFMCDLVRNKAEANSAEVAVHLFKDKIIQQEPEIKKLEWKLVDDQCVTNEPEYKILNSENEKDTHLLVVFVPSEEIEKVFHKKSNEKLYKQLESIKEGMGWQIKVFSVKVPDACHRNVDILSRGIYLQRQNGPRDISEYVIVSGQSKLDLDYYNPLTKELFTKWNEDDVSAGAWSPYSKLSFYGTVRFYDLTSGTMKKVKEFRLYGMHGKDKNYHNIQRDFKYSEDSKTLILWIIGDPKDTTNLRKRIGNQKRLKDDIEDIKRYLTIPDLRVMYLHFNFPFHIKPYKSRLISQLLYEHKADEKFKLHEYNKICNYEGDNSLFEYDDLSTPESANEYKKFAVVKIEHLKHLFNAKEDDTIKGDMSLEIYDFKNGMFDQYDAIKINMEVIHEYLTKVPDYTYMKKPTTEIYLLPIIITQQDIIKLFGPYEKFRKHKLFSFVKTLIRIANNKLNVQLWGAANFTRPWSYMIGAEIISQFMKKQSPFGDQNLRDKMRTYGFGPLNNTYADILKYENSEFDTFWADIGKVGAEEFDPVKSAVNHPFQLPGGSEGGSPPHKRQKTSTTHHQSDSEE